VKKLTWIGVLVIVLATASLVQAQETAGTITVTLTLTDVQVAALKEWRREREAREQMMRMPVPPGIEAATPVEPPTFREWLKTKLDDYMNSLVVEADVLERDTLGNEVRSLTQEERQSIRAAVAALKAARK
jgi:hypothetical protein